MPALYVDGTGVGVKVGAIAPDFTLKTSTNEDWKLSDHLGSVTVLLFYPQNETLVCTKQLCSVRDHWEDYLATKATIIGVSPADPEEHFQFAKRRKLPIPLLADPGRTVTRIFGRHWLFPISFTRAVVVIDAKGMVRNCDVMLRAFRPLDEKIITDIYAARGDAFNDKYDQIRQRSPIRDLVR
ncbi:MAG TPA: peroxiredoxin [Pyrinomonadaceae bacterium]|nr:peroxiredoxin [Acidobacteriota bacterium]HQZ96912.1 peroxiredoxin [Pyrinomonadaceae bacterium]